MRVFVIMPFNDQFTPIYRKVIKPTFVRMGCSVERADEVFGHVAIMKKVIQGIYRADLVVAEITSVNANVYYELGIAHGLNKRTLLLTQSVENMPFDLRAYNAIAYTNDRKDLAYLKSELRKAVKHIRLGKNEFASPVSDWLANSIDIQAQNSASNQSSLEAKQRIQDNPSDFEQLVQHIQELFMTVQDSSVRLVSSSLAITGVVQVATAEIKIAGDTFNQAIFDHAVNMIAKAYEDYAVSIEREIAILDPSWESIKKAFTDFFTMISISTNQDREAATGFLSILHNLVSELRKASEATTQASESVYSFDKLPGKDVGTQARRLVLALKRLQSSYQIGEAYLVRVITLTEEKLNEAG